MIGNNILRHIEPELGNLGENGSLLIYDIIQNHIKATDSVCGNHNQAVSVVINLTYFTLFDRLKFLNTHLFYSFIHIFLSVCSAKTDSSDCYYILLYSNKKIKSF